jgi:hypothetical protein
MTGQDAFRIRLGALALLASGVLSAVGLYLRGPIIDQATRPEAFSQAAVSPFHMAAWSLLLPSLVIQCFGFLALYAVVAHTPLDRLGFWGMVLSIAGNGLFLPFSGIIAFISPPVGQLYLGGQTNAIEIVNAGLAGLFAAPFFIGSALLLLVGSILVGLLLWRAPNLPRWTAIPYVLHALCLTFIAPYSYPLEFTGGILLLVSTAAIAWAIWQQTAQATSAPRAAAIV